jgi:hypothetical protein
VTVRVVKVIYSDEMTLGSGKDLKHLVRRLPALYTIDGDLICRYDCGDDGATPHLIVNDYALRKLERTS